MNTSCTKNGYYTLKWEGDIANLRDTKDLEIYDVLHYSNCSYQSEICYTEGMVLVLSSVIERSFIFTVLLCYLTNDITLSCMYWQVFIHAVKWLHLEPQNCIVCHQILVYKVWGQKGMHLMSHSYSRDKIAINEEGKIKKLFHNNGKLLLYYRMY